MKTILKCSVLMVALLVLWPATASINFTEKKKEIHKQYSINTNVLVGVSNQFGKVHIESWDKKELDVKIEIIARGRNDEQAQKLLNKINVAIDESSGEIEFETDIDGSTHDNESFEINYTIYMNPKNPLEVENEFGNIFLPKRIGPSEIELSYGSLKSLGAEGPFELDLSFGDAEIGALVEAEMEVSYSDLFLTSAKNLSLEQKFSKSEMEVLGQLDLEMKYGEIQIGRLDKGVFEGHFSEISIQELDGALELEGNYLSKFSIKKLKKTFTELEVSGQFSRYEIALEQGLSANIYAEFSYADMDYGDVDIDFYYRGVEDTAKEYKGYINGGDSNKNIRVTSSYGNLKLSQ
ncbi:hypothetical protein [Marinoscillum sp. MHG1-6]|uniref:hypothetical protein n=1 Tax=Marinoscillum sp. MHG1-6 TaxID=2959627 RepID=UPI0021580DBC|nr:hypothetical protein [Marinoscillum sp. MHG1-6]